MKKIIAIAAFGLLMITQNAYCQQPGYMSVQYAVSFGSGDLGDFISQPSFRGALFEYRSAIKDNLLWGFDIGWNVFYEEKENDTYTDGTQSLTGKQYRTQNQLPMLVSIDYLLISDQPLKPYVGLGIGTMYTERTTDMGTWRILENPWHFALKPEVGLLYELSYSTSAKVGVKYYAGFKSGELDEAQNYISVSAGFAFHL
jgi:opacity protein-like surface antigen